MQKSTSCSLSVNPRPSLKCPDIHAGSSCQAAGCLGAIGEDPTGNRPQLIGLLEGGVKGGPLQRMPRHAQASCSPEWLRGSRCCDNSQRADQHCGIRAQITVLRGDKDEFQYLAPSPPPRIASQVTSPLLLLRNHVTARSLPPTHPHKQRHQHTQDLSCTT